MYRKSNRIGAIGVNCKILALNDRTKREGGTKGRKKEKERERKRKKEKEREIE